MMNIVFSIRGFQYNYIKPLAMAVVIPTSNYERVSKDSKTLRKDVIRKTYLDW